MPHALRVQGAGPEGFKLKAEERGTDLGGHGDELRAESSSPFPPEHHRELKNAVAEAWAWLEGQGLILPKLEILRSNDPEFYPTNRRLSRRGQRLARDPQLALAARQLSKGSLHPLIREDVWALSIAAENTTRLCSRRCRWWRCACARRPVSPPPTSALS